MSLLDSFTWAPGQGMLDVAKNTSYQAGATRDFAQTDLVNTENAQKQAELQDYISQSAKDLRETSRQAAISEAAQKKMLSDTGNEYFKNNPGILDQYVRSGIAKDTNENLSKSNDAEFNLIQNTVGSAWDSKKMSTTLPVYTEQWNKLNETNPKAASHFVTPQELQEDPSMIDALNAQMSHVQENAKQRAASSLAGMKIEGRLDLQDAKNDMAMKIAMANIGGRQGVANTQAAASNYRADKTFEKAQLVHDHGAATGKIPGVDRYGSLVDNEGSLIEAIMGYAEDHDISGIDKTKAKSMVTQVFPMAQSIYTQQAEEAAANKAKGLPYAIPKAVPQIAQEILQQSATDENMAKTVTNFWGANKKNITIDGNFVKTPAPQATINPGGGKAPEVFKPTTEAEYNKLKSGDHYIKPGETEVRIKK